jgi:hypothetical protein
MTEEDNISFATAEVLQLDPSALQVRFQSELQRLLDIYTASTAGLKLVDKAAYEAFLPVLSMSPASNMRLSHVDAIAQAEQWHLRAVIRDAVELTSIFLDDCWRILALGKAAKNGKIEGDDVNRIIHHDADQFHKQGFPDKFKKLENNFSVKSLLQEHVLSVNKARVCLVHRLGLVSKLDFNNNNELVILWRTKEWVARNPDNSQEFVIEPPCTIKDGWHIVIVDREKRKIFGLGETLHFSYREITDTMWCLMAFSEDLTHQVLQYCLAQGVEKIQSS